MSENDSFLSEVSEEVRRDQLTAFLRKNAIWIASAVIVIVGGAAFMEWQKAAARAEAEARGDRLWAALQLEAGTDRIAAIDAISMDTADGEALLAFQRAASHLADDNRAGAVSALEGVAARGDVSDALRDVARLKLVGIAQSEMTAQAREDLLLPLLTEGHPLNALALEQRALLRLEEGDLAAAIEDLEAIGNDPQAPQDVQQRADQILTIIAPGETQNG